MHDRSTHSGCGVQTVNVSAGVATRADKVAVYGRLEWSARNRNRPVRAAASSSNRRSFCRQGDLCAHSSDVIIHHLLFRSPGAHLARRCCAGASMRTQYASRSQIEVGAPQERRASGRLASRTPSRVGSTATAQTRARGKPLPGRRGFRLVVPSGRNRPRTSTRPWSVNSGGLRTTGPYNASCTARRKGESSAQSVVGAEPP